MSKQWDFSGWATKANIKCSDGRTILPNAFSECDGMTVPLVWNHRHNDPSEVLGHALLENRDEGVYAYCSFNDNEKGREAKELVRHGDIKALSIYANQLVQSSKIPPCDVIHGAIREVSLVLAGANIGAFIDNVLVHGEIVEDEAEIFHGDDDEDFVIYHAEEKSKEDEESSEKTVKIKDVLDTLTPEQKAAVGMLLDQVLQGKDAVRHSDEDNAEESEDESSDVEEKNTEDESEENAESEKEEEDDAVNHSDEEESDDDIEDVLDSLTAEQREAVETAIGMKIDGDDDDIDELLESFTPKQKSAFNKIVDIALKHADELKDEEDKDDNFDDVISTLNSKQKKAIEDIIGVALTDNNKKNESDEEENKEMKHNVFENYEVEAPVISHADQKSVIELAKSVGSLKRAVEQSMQEGGVLAHAITDHNGESVTYGIANVDYMFPDARAIGTTPELVSMNQDWVNKVINGTHHTPFSRVKSLYADLTGADARARGYVKGKQKVEEVIEALQRETNPQTIYKKQKLDRDDVLDITDFDVVAWLKAEMQIMLKAEIARAILIGDGRQAGDDKIKENCVRPIYNDNDTYTIKVPVDFASNATDNVKASAIIDAVILSRKLYKGSGNPTFFINEDYLGQMLILKDGMGRRIYETEASLAAALRVKELVPVDVMDGQKIEIEGAQKDLVGVIVNLQDYNVGADKGGQTSFFDDFDIDYNQYKYLYETRMSGALVKPYSAMSIYMNPAA